MKLAAGEITSINDFITYNLDIRQFALDAITYSEGIDLLNAFYESLEQITILAKSLLLPPLTEANMRYVSSSGATSKSMPSAGEYCRNQVSSFTASTFSIGRQLKL